ncbi:MAG: polyphosphate kinase 1 [Gammaproteobacteria bacterium]|jgi:polyphosphate kinase|nr:polyphosphate kinase 1 [Gammaproteobacteria bacterium]MBT3859243.1 polyphosphate kinase 1 [Gammaproteobacteria bacterium]MBT3988111.1 polyphosphate kinase 1 [Gammaproteobacteria bacterium]MBT4256666.1 polyphosphate kinase 1 [Gammaproteobacteria bacterium]MBT4583042.1 polyphosphate kinase 1 [Gammaproteobacteria bacterium]
MSEPVSTNSLEVIVDNSKPAEAAANSKNAEKLVDLTAPEYYENRELSHFKFNLRVLRQAKNHKHPLLERLMFLLIFSSNLDEFFEIRVSGLKKQLDFGLQRPGPDGKYPEQVLKIIHEQVRDALDEQYSILNNDLFPSLAKEDIHFLPRVSWSDELIEWTNEYFHKEILPVVSPLGLDPAHPFPRLVNKSLNFILSLNGKDAFGRDSGLAIVPAPRSLPRLIKVPESILPKGDNFIFLSSIIHAHVNEFFSGMTVTECHQFRVTRNSDLEMSNVEVEDFAIALQGQLHSRRFGAATKLEVGIDCPDELTNFLLERFDLTRDELYPLDGPVNLQRLMALYKMVDRPDLQYPKFSPGTPKGLSENNQIFSAVDKEDQLLLHPFQSFIPIIEWLRQAAKDPSVVSIKQTLYRTNESSELVEALAEAARNGKEVTVVIELRARFDEEENINFASILQEAGAVVVYGVMGYKTHAKMLLFVRRVGNDLKRYAHLGTGNYHRKNSLLYTDYSLMTADETVCADVHKVFQQITGMGKKIHPKLLIHAPFNLRKSIVKMINAEAEAAKAGVPARIIAKLNALTDVPVIEALYAASIAGVKVDLIVRGICCLRPGIPLVSENIRVISTIGRFLEHSRVYYFENSEPQVYCSSADWMERNLSNRIEVCFPILKKKHASRIVDELNMYLEDDGQSWELHPDGVYREITPELNSEFDVQNLLLQKLS